MIVAVRPTARHCVLYWLPVLAWMGAIFLLSSLPPPAIEETRGELAISELAGERLSWVVHVVEFATLAVLARRLLASYPALARWQVWAGAFALTAGWGLVDEFYQFFLPRDSSFVDVGIDAAGAMAGLVLAEAVARLYALVKKKRPAV